jgi:hypothetical protein
VLCVVHYYIFTRVHVYTVRDCLQKQVGAETVYKYNICTLNDEYMYFCGDIITIIIIITSQRQRRQSLNDGPREIENK